MGITTVAQALAGGTLASTSSTFTAAMTVAVNDFIVVVTHVDNHTSGTPAVVTISDGHNVWTRQGFSSSSVSGHAQRTEVWTTLNSFAGSLTITMTNGSSTDDFTGVATAYRGVDTTTPILDAVSFVTNYTATAASATFTQTVTTTGAMVVGMHTGLFGLSLYGLSSDRKATSAGGGTLDSNAAMADQTGTAGSLTYNWGSNSYNCQAGLTLKPFTVTMSGSIATNLTKAAQSVVAKASYTGTVSTKLTKPSQAIAGKTDVRGSMTSALTKAKLAVVAQEKFTGTVTTALTKPSQALAGTEKLTGTMATQLTRAVMSAMGTANIVITGTTITRLTRPSMAAVGGRSTVGTMTTVLTKPQQALAANARLVANITTVLGPIRQSIAGAQSFAGSMTTRLTRPSMAAVAQETFTGSIVTALSKVQQHAQAPAGITATITTALRPTSQVVTGTEKFIGSIVTAIDPGGLHVNALTYEQFIGHIVTNLGPAKMAANASEIFTGRIVTKIGASAGGIVASVVQGLEIIEGPIVTTLPPVRPLVLGATLGTPGGGKWFSWRYTDA